jgi:MoxR-like ATPase
VNVDEVSAALRRFSAEIARVLVGQEALIEQVLIGLLARGHILIEGVPGLGKTLLVRCLGRVLGLSFRRIQFTPDLMPSDVTGSNVYSEALGQFSFVPGPVFAQLVLADEINRAPAKTQSALLEAMQDRSVTIDGVTRALPAPFLVLGTQNPLESQGTYPLPEAQLDRFLLKLEVRYPSRDAEADMLRNYLVGFDPTELSALSVLSSEAHILELQRAVGDVQVAPEIVDYITDIVRRTRSYPALALGASPRASIALLCVARAHALWEGRDYVTPDDVKAYAPAVLRHRLLLQPDAELEGTTADHCVDAILRDSAVPKSSV